MPLAQLARRQLLRPLTAAATAMRLRPLSASLLMYLSTLRGMRGGATFAAAVMPPSDFSHLGLSDIGQTSTAVPDTEHKRPITRLECMLERRCMHACMCACMCMYVCMHACVDACMDA